MNEVSTRIFRNSKKNVGLTLYRFIARHILAPSLDTFRGTQSMTLLKELEKSQWWPRQKILNLQNERLRLLVQHAYDEVPYYRRIFDERGLRPGDIKDGRDLARLPVLTKQFIRDNFDEITAQCFPRKGRVKLATGGSTGQPLVFYTTRRDHKDVCIAARQRAFSGVGFELGDKTATIRNIYPGESMIERLWRVPIQFFRRDLPVDIRYVSPDSARQIEAFQPRFITGYPSAIEKLARLLQTRGKSRIVPAAIITGAEQLYDHQRDLFRKIFGCDTYSFYGAREAHLIAFECFEHSGHHMAAENVIVEIADAQGSPVPVGVEGRILITNLQNYAMPFIRYDIGDIGTASDEICPCGRGLPLLASINGRNPDNILTKSKGTIAGMALCKPLRLLAGMGLEQCQIVQETPNNVVIKLVAGSECAREALEELRKKALEEYIRILGEDMDIAVEFVEKIAMTPGGKGRFVISKLSHTVDQAPNLH
jgi:phenylacetate-CoA ligase